MEGTHEGDMTPTDTIREYLSGFPKTAPCHAALTELEQQAAAKEGEWVRKPMWDAMLARAEAAEADRDRWRVIAEQEGRDVDTLAALMETLREVEADRERYRARIVAALALLHSIDYEEESKVHRAIIALDTDPPVTAPNTLKTCPYCACTYELPTGWSHDSCPGCRRAEAAEADHHRLQEELSRYQGIAAEAEDDRDRLQQRERDLEAYYEEHTAEIERLADTLREIRVEAGYSTDGEDPIIARIRAAARAALDRHTTDDYSEGDTITDPDIPTR